MTYLDIPLERLLVPLALVGVAVLISVRMRLGMAGQLLLGALRGAVQLLAVGYLLVLLFAHPHPVWVMTLLCIMLLVAAWTSSGRVGRTHHTGLLVLLPRAHVAILVGSAVALVPVFALVVTPTPWFDRRYLVPLSGMIVANAMNVVAQVHERIFASATSDWAQIEQLLALGATPEQALAPQARAAVRAALIPTLNGLVTVGLVALPGMMTGQILSGTAPDHAVRYQIVILYQLVAVAAVSGALAAYFARRLLFSKWDQLLVRRGA